MIRLTEPQIRELVFECSVLYAQKLQEGWSVQEAEWARSELFDSLIDRFAAANAAHHT